MTTEEGVAQAHLAIRTSRYQWVSMFVSAGVWLAIASVELWLVARPLLALLTLATGCLWLAAGLLIRSFGVDLTPGSAVVRGLRRRSVPWSQVQAVVQHQAKGTWSVRLILESGQPLTLPAPTAWGGFGGPGYERDFHRIGQWWLSHRGEPWRPLRPEAPALSFQ